MCVCGGGVSPGLARTVWQMLKCCGGQRLPAPGSAWTAEAPLLRNQDLWPAACAAPPSQRAGVWALGQEELGQP
jgi:hypothetical protein